MTKASQTRLVILQKSFELIYKRGYQATSIDDIIANTKVTKGAFFYHFKNKEEMGLAVIHEIMLPVMTDSFIEPLRHSEHPSKEIYAMIKYLLLEDPDLHIKYGCPAGNLIHEMAPLNAEFSLALLKITEGWQLAIKQSIQQAKKNGLIKPSVQAGQVAYFVMSGYWGIRHFGKLSNNKACYVTYLKELKNYLNSLS